MNKIEKIKLDKDKEKTESIIEGLLLREFHRVDLYPEPQFWIDKYRVDFAFPERMLVVEADGYNFHKDREKEDRERDEYLEKNGWLVLRFTFREIVKQGDEIAKSILKRKMFEPRVRREKLEYEWPEIDEENMFPEEIEEKIAQRKEILEELENKEIRDNWKKIGDVLKQ